jgi:UDP-N-acetylglucosamine 2-epimerase (non-hydrolysing)
MLIHLVCAARPNFMKVAPLYHALKKEPWAKPVIVHTGQHYDLNMSEAFFEDLALPKPDIYLGVGSGTHAEQTGKVMVAYEKVLSEQRPDLVIVVGDVNSTMAATIAASKIVYPINQSPDGQNEREQPHNPNRPNEPDKPDKPNKPYKPIKLYDRRRPLVAHLEAGLRSFDRTMPEEINRLVTDVLADMLWTPSRDAGENLAREGISQDKIRLVGNIMIDSLEMLREKIERQKAYLDFGLEAGAYGVVTLHRPSNVDDPGVLKKIFSFLKEIADRVPLIFPIHPRTRKNLEENHLLSEMDSSGKLFLPKPLNYVRFMNLVFNCRLVITDSGGIQEETTYLGIPCLTLRENTERPITVTHGTNQLCGLDDLKEKVNEILVGRPCRRKKIDLWDGKTASRIVENIRAFSGGSAFAS